MRTLSGSTLAGFGHAVPQRIVPNAEIEAQLGLEDGWIARRTGIETRRWAEPHDTLSDLAARAGQAALDSAGIDPNAIGLVLLATSTPDHLLPPSAPLVAHKLGLAHAGGVDMAGACAGFIYALMAADNHARLWGKAVLVIAANILSRRINTAERASSVLFADAAGAVVVQPVADTARGIVGHSLATQGAHYGLVHIPAGGSNAPFSEETQIEDTRMTMPGGRELFVQAVGMMTDCAKAALAEAELSAGDVDYFVPHQANSRIFEMIAHNLGVDENKVLRSIAEYGNSSAGTIPLTLSLAHERRAFESGETLLLTGAGAGLTGGAVVLRL